MLHQSAVIHGRKHNQVGLCLDVLQPQLIKIEVKADGHRNPAEITLEDRGLLATENATVNLPDRRMVLVIDTDNFPLAIDQHTGIAPGVVGHGSLGGIDHIAAVLASHLCEEILNLILPHPIVCRQLFTGKTQGTIARLRHHDEVRSVRQHAGKQAAPVGNDLQNHTLWFRIRPYLKGTRADRGNSHNTFLLFPRLLVFGKTGYTGRRTGSRLWSRLQAAAFTLLGISIQRTRERHHATNQTAEDKPVGSFGMSK